MNIHQRCQHAILLLISILLLAGCTTPGRGMLPEGGDMTMPEIYKSESGLTLGEGSDSSESHFLSDIRKGVDSTIERPNYVAYTATSRNEVKNLFKRLPNPEVPFYVYPHLVYADGEAFPKPGMTSSFFLYRSNHYAMPNEKY